MKLVTYLREEVDQLAMLVNGQLYNVQELHPDLPTTMHMFLQMWEEVIDLAIQLDAQLKAGKMPRATSWGVPYESAQLLAPVPFPSSCRDGYAFRQHVAAARRNRKVDMIPEFDQYPIFYFTNHNAIQGPGEILCMPDHFRNLDFELEAAIVICKRGRNITAAEADEYIGGYMIMNDMSARLLPANGGNETEPRPRQRQRFLYRDRPHAGYTGRTGTFPDPRQRGPHRQCL
jgi:fumarylacetoacetate (FAA) hydrolase